MPGSSLTVARVHGVDVAVAICEDIWQEGGPVAVAREAGAGLLLVINGSPYERNKDDVRLDLVRRRAAGAGCALAYVNMVGGQDELVFDGDSLVVDAGGDVLARAPAVRRGAARRRPRPAGRDRPDRRRGRATSWRRTAPRRRSSASCSRPSRCRAWEPVARAGAPSASTDEAEVYGALVLGLRDYVGKNGFRSVLLGLSGGIDSALVAAIACDALGAENVYGVSKPSDYSSEALAHRRRGAGRAHRA